MSSTNRTLFHLSSPLHYQPDLIRKCLSTSSCLSHTVIDVSIASRVCQYDDDESDLYGYIHYKHRLLVESGIEDDNVILSEVIFGLNETYKRILPLSEIDSLTKLYQFVFIPLFLPAWRSPAVVAQKNWRRLSSKYPIANEW